MKKTQNNQILIKTGGQDQGASVGEEGGLIQRRKKKKRRSAPGPLGDFCIVSFKNSVSFYFVKKIRKLPSILNENCL